MIHKIEVIGREVEDSPDSGPKEENSDEDSEEPEEYELEDINTNDL